MGFEPTIPASVRPQTYALDCAATGISFAGHNCLYIYADYAEFLGRTYSHIEIYCNYWYNNNASYNVCKYIRNLSAHQIPQSQAW
jgi:hypothetical protein